MECKYDEAIRKWIDSMSEGKYSYSTVKAYFLDCMQWSHFVKNRDINQSVMDEWMEWLFSTMKKRTALRKISSVRGLLGFYEKEIGDLPDIKWPRLRFDGIQNPATPPITMKEWIGIRSHAIEAIHGGDHGDAIGGLGTLLAGTIGLSVESMCALKNDDWSGFYLHVECRGDLLLPDWLVPYVHHYVTTYANPHGHWFVVRHDDPISHSELTKKIKRATNGIIPKHLEYWAWYYAVQIEGLGMLDLIKRFGRRQAQTMLTGKNLWYVTTQHTTEVDSAHQR